MKPTGPRKKEFQTIEIKSQVPSETTTSPQNTQKQNLKILLIIIDRESNTLHHQAKGALHIHIKDPSLNRNIGKVRIPSVFNKLLKPPPDNQIFHIVLSPHPRGHLLYLVFQHKRLLTLNTFLISIYKRSVIPMFILFKLHDN